MKHLILAIVLFLVTAATCSAQSWRYADNHQYRRGACGPARMQQQYRPQYRPPGRSPHYRPPSRHPQARYPSYRSPSIQMYFGPHYNTRPYGSFQYQYRGGPGSHYFRFSW